MEETKRGGEREHNAKMYLGWLTKNTEQTGRAK